MTGLVVRGFVMNIKEIRNNRIIDLRAKILRRWTLESLMNFCIMNLKVSKQTAQSYIDEAAAPYRKKFQEEKIESET